MKHNALAITLTLVVSALLAAFLWWDYRREVPPPPSRQLPPAVPTPAPQAMAPPAARPSPAQGVYRCEDHRGTRYQTHPCESGSRQKAIGAGTVSTVSPPPVRAPARQAAAAEAESDRAHVGFIAQAPREEEGNEADCQHHEREIKRIDARARQGSSSQTQEWLRERRRWHKDRMWDLRCGF